MKKFAQIAGSIAWTTRKTEKTQLLAEYLTALPLPEARLAAMFFSGRAFPAHEETILQVGGALLWRLAAEIAGVSEAELSEAYRRYGDLGDAAEEVFNLRKPAAAPGPEISLGELAESFRKIAAARGPAAKTEILRPLLIRASPAEAKYIIKIMLGDLRIGSKESLVEEALAKAFGAKVKDVQRANMMLGDIGETLQLAAADRLAEARPRLFHPIDFMLANPVESAQEAFEAFGPAVQFSVEDKYDGIRAQAHIGNKDGHRVVRIFSRTRDDVTESFPELVHPLGSIQGELILDGEIVAWQQAGSAGHAMPFSELQKRLGRKKVAEGLLASVPVAYLVFDILHCDGELLIDHPLAKRYEILTSRLSLARGQEAVATVDPQGRLAFEPAVTAQDRKTEIIRAPYVQAASHEELEHLFQIARERGNEGLMLKDLSSMYTPGRRGRAWLKLKRELATLDVVVTAAEFGHGKRASVLSDYTFAVRDEQDGNRLLNIGKAYSGLTDVEIADLTRWFLEHTTMDEGFRRQVEPKIVLEVAFNNMMKSDRHASGFALRFPRILRIRTDKRPEEVDTLATVRDIFARQHQHREH